MVGMHTTERGEPAISVITVSTVSTSGSRPDLVIASMAGAVPDRPEDGIVPSELPCDTAFFDEQKQPTTVPGSAVDRQVVVTVGTTPNRPRPPAR